MFRLFKKKYAYPEIKCPCNAREMTDEERDIYFETETSRYGWTVAAGIAKVSSKTVLDGPAANANFDYVNAELSWMNSPEHTKMGFNFELFGFGGEFGIQTNNNRFTIGSEKSKIGFGLSFGFERTGDDIFVDLGPLKGVSFSLENQ